MITLLLANKFSENIEPSTIWYIAAAELLCADAPAIGMLLKMIFG
jgi:hypothetical protein